MSWWRWGPGEVVLPCTSLALPVLVRSTVMLSLLFSKTFGPHSCSVFQYSVYRRPGWHTHSIFRSRISDCILSQFAECWKVPLSLSVSWSWQQQLLWQGMGLCGRPTFCCTHRKREARIWKEVVGKLLTKGHWHTGVSQVQVLLWKKKQEGSLCALSSLHTERKKRIWFLLVLFTSMARLGLKL